MIDFGAGGGIRTHTSGRISDFARKKYLFDPYLIFLLILVFVNNYFSSSNLQMTFLWKINKQIFKKY
jgi:hypothetical protein